MQGQPGNTNQISHHWSSNDPLPKYYNFLLPTVIPPPGPHTHTLIFLHGRGDQGLEFGTELITRKLPTGPRNTLPARFPGLKFIFPNAPVRLDGPDVHLHGVIPQWFEVRNVRNLDQSSANLLESDDRTGLTESVQYIHELIDQEANLVEVGNVIIGGLSQGGALALYALLTYDDLGKGKLGGVVGLSTWLPFEKILREVRYQDNRDEIRDESVDRNEVDSGPMMTAVQKVLRYAREYLTPMNPTSAAESIPASINTPIFLAHGAKDEHIRPANAKAAADLLEGLGWDVDWRLYEDLEHCYSPDELEDMTIWLSVKIGVPEHD